MDRFQVAVEDAETFVRPQSDQSIRAKLALLPVRLACGSSILVASFLAGTQIGAASIRAWPLATALLVPFTLAGVLLALGAGFVCARTLNKLPPSIRAEETFIRVLLLTFCGLGVLVVGGYASNALFIDEPFSRMTLVGYAVTLVTIVLVWGLGWHVLKTRRLTETFGWRPLVTGTLLFGGSALAFLDILFLPTLYHKLHLLIGGGSIFLLSAAALSGHRVWPGVCGRLSLSVCGLLAAVSLISLFSSYDMTAAVLRDPNAARRTLTLLRDATDRDGDGYSSLFGGGDCDDADPDIHPLSTTGRDCLGWSQRPLAAPSSKVTPVLSRATAGPEVILLLTIDAFRCGFGKSDRVELRNACPRLTQVARAGRFLADGHTPHPDTRAAMDAIMRVQSETWDEAAPLLPDVLRQLGYGSRAVATHTRALAVKGLRQSLERVDQTLTPLAMSVGGITSEAVTDRVLVEATAALATRTPILIWAHYYDPHAPYVEVPGSPFAFSSLDGYVAEVRRTDEAIGRLVSTLHSNVDDGRILVVITADHGEEFGEHGSTRHGSNLYETTTRVPFIAWRSGADARAGLPEQVPINHDEIGRYVIAVVTGRPFASTGRTLLRSKNEADPQLAIVHEGWKLLYHERFVFWELYNLRADPEERFDLALRYPRKVQSLGRMLASEYWARQRQ